MLLKTSTADQITLYPYSKYSVHTEVAYGRKLTTPSYNYIFLSLNSEFTNYIGDV